MWVPLLFVLLDECFGVCIDGKDCLIRFVCDSVVDTARGCEVSVLEKFSQLHSGVAFGLDMFMPHPGNGNVRRCPLMVTLLYASTRSA